MYYVYYHRAALNMLIDVNILISIQHQTLVVSCLVDLCFVLSTFVGSALAFGINFSSSLLTSVGAFSAVFDLCFFSSFEDSLSDDVEMM